MPAVLEAPEVRPRGSPRRHASSHRSGRWTACSPPWPAAAAAAAASSWGRGVFFGLLLGAAVEALPVLRAEPTVLQLALGTALAANPRLVEPAGLLLGAPASGGTAAALLRRVPLLLVLGRVVGLNEPWHYQ